MKNNFHTFEEVSRIDAELFKLATYQVTKGMLVASNNMEGLMDMQQKIITQFNYFKKQIQNNETTFEHLTQQILSKYGPFPRSDLELNAHNVDEIIANADESYEECEDVFKKIEEDKRFSEFMDRFNGILSGMAFKPPLYNHKNSLDVLKNDESLENLDNDVDLHEHDDQDDIEDFKNL